MFRWVYGATIFIAAFLVFYVQPLIAKSMLPIFGGSAFVWMVSILFFQIALLLGYLYAYLLCSHFSDRTQCLIHLFLLFVSLYFIPISLSEKLILNDVWPPFAVLHLLTFSVLLPLIIVSSTSPLLQHWFCRIQHTEFPFYYYSISNAGSLLGLLGFVFILEPIVGIQFQKYFWSFLYILFVGLSILCLRKLYFIKSQIPTYIKVENITFFLTFKWISYSFLSSTLLLSVTQFLSYNAINLPLLWIVPLTLYLISFIVVFSNQKTNYRETWMVVYLIWMILATFLVYKNELSGINVIIVLCALLFSACMVCHGELLRLKSSQKDLTIFYLCIAFGGVLGGVFVNIVSLLIFKNWWDFYIPLIILNLIIVHIYFYSYQSIHKTWGLMILMVAFSAILFLMIAILKDYRGREIIARIRNPYGVIKIEDEKFQDKRVNYRAIYHGKVLHGLQYFEKNRRRWLTTYYSHQSGVGAAFQYFRGSSKHPIRVGVIGLGSGTLAAYAKPGDKFSFYEIDNDIINIARYQFTYLTESFAKIKLILGDARVKLKEDLKNRDHEKYDLIIVDAFSGDVIPYHLLTKEAMEIYTSYLKEEGIIAFHITNTYLNLLPVIHGLAVYSKYFDYPIFNQSDYDNGIFMSNWVLVSRAKTVGPWLIQRKDFHVVNTATIKPILWTDDLNSILPLLKWN